MRYGFVMDNALQSNGDPWRRGPRTALAWTFWLYTSHPLLPSLALVAALGRAIQVGWAERHAPMLKWLLELPVEGARLMFILALLGAGSLRRGVSIATRSAKRLDRNAGSAPASTEPARAPRERRRSVIVLVTVLGLGVLVLNRAIAALAETPTARALVAAAFEADTEEAALAIVLFLKNLTVIPLWMIGLAALYRLLRK